MARSLGGGAVGKLFKSVPAIGVCLVLLGCTLEKSSIISGRVTDVLANDVIRVGDKDVRLCGVKATTKNSPWYYAAKGYLIDRVQYRKVQCHISDTVTPCIERTDGSAKSETVAQCFMYGRDLTQVLAGFTPEVESTHSLVREFKTTAPRKDFRSDFSIPTSMRLETIATHAW
jgi:hypothetical protein